MDIVEHHLVDDQISRRQGTGCRRSGHSSSNMSRQIKGTAARRLVLWGQTRNVDILPRYIEVQGIANGAFEGYRSRIGRNVTV